MYQVKQQGRIVQSFSFFFEAWLYVRLELQSFARIVGPDGIWTINPPLAN